LFLFLGVRGGRGLLLVLLLLLLFSGAGGGEVRYFALHFFLLLGRTAGEVGGGVSWRAFGFTPRGVSRGMGNCHILLGFFNFLRRTAGGKGVSWRVLTP